MKAFCVFRGIYCSLFSAFHPTARLEMPEGVSIETEVVTIDDDDQNLRSSLDVIPSYKAVSIYVLSWFCIDF